MSLTFTQVLGIVLWNFITIVHYMAPQFTYPIFPKDFDIYPKGFRISLVPRPSCFVVQFAFIIIHENRRAAKNGEGLGTLIT